MNGESAATHKVVPEASAGWAWSILATGGRTLNLGEGKVHCEDVEEMRVDFSLADERRRFHVAE